MLKIKVKQDESIERALKRYKRKFKKTKLLDEIRERQHYTKKSKQRRETLKKAEHRQQYLLENAE